MDATRRLLDRLGGVWAVMFAVSVGVGLAAAAAAAPQDSQPITVTGCVERDAAASRDVYRLVVPEPDNKVKMYRLVAPANIDVGAALGHNAEVNGTPSTTRRNGREENSLAVKSLKVVADRCPSPF